jgi:hypothetical protein
MFFGGQWQNFYNLKTYLPQLENEKESKKEHDESEIWNTKIQTSE